MLWQQLQRPEQGPATLYHSRYGAYVKAVVGGPDGTREEIPFRKFVKAYCQEQESALRIQAYHPLPVIRLLTKADEESLAHPTAQHSQALAGRCTLDSQHIISFYLTDAHYGTDDCIRCDELRHLLPNTVALCATVTVGQAAANQPNIGSKRPREMKPKKGPSNASKAQSKWGKLGWSPLAKVQEPSSSDFDDEPPHDDEVSRSNVPVDSHIVMLKLCEMIQIGCKKVGCSQLPSSNDQSEQVRAVLSQLRSALTDMISEGVGNGALPITNYTLSLPPEIAIAAFGSARVAPRASTPRSTKELLLLRSPLLAMTLKSYQLVAVGRALGIESEGYHHARGRMLLADEMGLGKTLQALGIVAGLQQLHSDNQGDAYPSPFPLLIVCPASVRPMWASESEKYLQGIMPNVGSNAQTALSPGLIEHPPSHFVWTVTGHESKLADDRSVTPPIVVVSRQLVGTLFDLDYKGRRWGTVIVDESHMLKTTLTTEACHTTAAITTLCHQSPYALMLSGTPSLTSPFDLYQQLVALRPDLFGGSYKEVNAASAKEDFGFAFTEAFVGNAGGGFLHFGKCVRLQEFKSILNRCIWVRREKGDVQKELEQIGNSSSIKRIAVNVKAAIQQQVSQVDDRPGSDCESTESEIETSENVEPPSMTPYHLTGLAKAPSLYPLINKVICDHIISAPPSSAVVLFAHHLDVMDYIQGMVEDLLEGSDMQTITRRIDGSTPMPVRETILNQFKSQTGSVRILIVAITACGVGVSQMAIAAAAVFCELPSNIAWLLQAEGRLARPRSQAANTTEASECEVYICVATNVASDRRLWNRLQKGFHDVAAVMNKGSHAITKELSDKAELQSAAAKALYQAAHTLAMLALVESEDPLSLTIGCRVSKFSDNVQIVAARSRPTSREENLSFHLVGSFPLTLAAEVSGLDQASIISIDGDWDIPRLILDFLKHIGLQGASEARETTTLTDHQRRQLIVSGAVCWERTTSPIANKIQPTAAASVMILSKPWGKDTGEPTPFVKKPRYDDGTSDPLRDPPLGCQWCRLQVPLLIDGQPKLTTHLALLEPESAGATHARLFSLRCLNCRKGTRLANLRSVTVSQLTATPIDIPWSEVAPPVSVAVSQTASSSPYLSLFCCGECRSSYFLTKSSHSIRKVVGRFDLGVCNHCHVDGQSLLSELQAIGGEGELTSGQLANRVRLILDRQPEFVNHTKLLHRLAKTPTSGNMWHADHATPVRAGGGLATLENLQTLCVVCHAQKTRLEEARYGKR